MAFDIVLQFNASDREHLDKELTDLDTLEGTLRADCNIVDPVILIDAAPGDLTGCNYFTIDEFGRSYFLTGIHVVRSNLLEISGHVDVLTSFKGAIRNQTAIVQRAQSPDSYNLYLNDGSLRTYQNPYILTEVFPDGFTGHSFILSVSGNAGGTP